jgi:signal transduction histidine kinase
MNVQLSEGASLIKMMPNSRQPITKSRFTTVLRGEQVSYETSFEANDQSTSWYHVNILPVNDETNQVLGAIICSEDISQRKTTEIERDKMTTDLMVHNKNLEQFSYIVSHNLRAPVANILGLAGLINNANLSGADFKKCVDGLVQSVNKLDDVIIDLNYILQARRNINEKKEMVRFSVLVSDICAIISELIEKEQVSIRTHFEADSMFTVKSYLHSIFLNLITNSIKYRDPAVATVIDISSRQTANRIIVTFRDNGLGIDMEVHKDKIFGLYKKFHMHKEGKGMGLYMVKTQVEILGGTISIKSEVNKGTEFVLDFEK